ncbi:L-threonylcarbamoyladenylate synthase [Chloroflexota bacterium]
MRNSPDKQVKIAIDILVKGGIVAYPTDTVYGLGASSRDEGAVGKVYGVKKRSREMALPLLISDKSELEKVASVIPEMAWRLAERFMPGGLTLVLKKSDSVSDTITACWDTVAVRVPDHPVPIALIRGLGAPLIGTSANVSGSPSPVTAREVRGQLGEGVDLIIDGGRCPGGIESTIVDVSGEIPAIIREGAITRHEIEEVCGPSLLVL